MKTLFITVMICLAINCRAQLEPTVIYNFAGGTEDLSGNGNNGTLHAGATAITALKLGDNDDDYLSIPAEAISGMDDFTLSMRIKFKEFHTTGSFPTNHIFSGSRSGCVQCFGASYEKPLNVWKLALNGTVYTFADDAVITNNWYCISYIRLDGIITFYKDGVSMGSYSDASEIDITSFLIGQEDDCVGGCFVANQSTYASVDNFQIWNGFHYGCNYKAHDTKLAESETFSDESDFTLYPNPSNDRIFIECADDRDGMINILTLGGEVIYSEKITGKNAEIGISELSAGIYLVSITGDKDSSFRKLIVQK